MRRWMGLIGSWALLVLALGLLGYALTTEAINLRDSASYREYQRINKVMREWKEERLENIEREMETSAARVSHLEGEVESKEAEIRDLRDTRQVITVSTEENKVYLRRDGEVLFEGVASTGKGFTRLAGGKMRDFATPVGRFKIISKEENPVWVPPDWHYLEKSSNVVRLSRGSVIGTPDNHLKVVGNNVVRVSNGMQTTLPQGQEIYFGGAIVIPPIGTQQRRYPDVLGTRRLNLGDGYALHGTQAVSQLGQSVSHGCIRLRNADIEKLYEMVNVGDEVIIY
jgi:hypothetical protein